MNRTPHPILLPPEGSVCRTAGVLPSSAAATFLLQQPSDALKPAAPEDGRTPPYTGTGEKVPDLSAEALAEAKDSFL